MYINVVVYMEGEISNREAEDWDYLGSGALTFHFLPFSTVLTS